jgi:hypothetical protein
MPVKKLNYGILILLTTNWVQWEPTHWPWSPKAHARAFGPPAKIIFLRRPPNAANYYFPRLERFPIKAMIPGCFGAWG